MATLLRAVCGKGGTAPIADIPGYEVAGKTGTTQKIINGRYSSSHHVASFAGFFPVNDPKLAITVIIDEPQGEGVGYGGKVSAPIFRDVAEKCIRWLDIPPVSPVPRTHVADLGR
jgi:cell division protein FtsI/penicillin-binding protein 2